MRLAAFAALALVTGCSDVPPTITAQNGRVWEHRCPAAGTAVRTSDNLTISYAGALQPRVCRLSGGRVAVAGFWVLSPGMEMGSAQEWLGRLFPATAGRTSTANVVNRSVRGQDTYMFMREAKVLGFEMIAVPAGRFDTVVIEWISAGTGNNISRVRDRRWLDTNTGATVQSESRIIAGIGPEHAWQAVSVSSPQRDPAVMPNVQLPRALPEDPRPLPQKP